MSKEENSTENMTATQYEEKIAKARKELEGFKGQLQELDERKRTLLLAEASTFTINKEISKIQAQTRDKMIHLEMLEKLLAEAQKQEAEQAKLKVAKQLQEEASSIETDAATYLSKLEEIWQKIAPVVDKIEALRQRAWALREETQRSGIPLTMNVPDLGIPTDFVAFARSHTITSFFRRAHKTIKDIKAQKSRRR